MPDLIHALHRAIGLFNPQLVQFRPEVWGAEGIEHDKHRARQSRIGRQFSHRFFSRSYPVVPGRVHLHDNMLMNDSPAEIAHYVKVGESALENIEIALRAASKEWSGIKAVLDFPSGYGRVLRHLARKIDPRRITACELEEDGVMFCAQEFGVRPLISTRHLDELNFSEHYDLIWVGSLFTHLPPQEGKKLLIKLAAQLAHRGVLVFSTQGPSCLARAEDYGFMFRGRAREFDEQYQTAGHAYLDYYPRNPGYGIAFYRPDSIREIFMRDLSNCNELLYRSRGLDEHQDIWAIQKG